MQCVDLGGRRIIKKNSMQASGIINEETQATINEAWESQINEARETIRAELREEFSGRYEHDKNVMVEALDKMVTENLTAELKELSLIHISEPTRPLYISYAVFCLKKVAPV